MMWEIRSNELVRSIDEVLLNQVGQISLKCSCLIFENFDPYDQFDAFWLDNSRKNLTHQN